MVALDGHPVTSLELGLLGCDTSGRGSVCFMARPTGVGRAVATYDMPIEGRDEWLAAARRLA